MGEHTVLVRDRFEVGAFWVKEKEMVELRLGRGEYDAKTGVHKSGAITRLVTDKTREYLMETVLSALFPEKIAVKVGALLESMIKQCEESKRAQKVDEGTLKALRKNLNADSIPLYRSRPAYGWGIDKGGPEGKEEDTHSLML